MQATKPMKIRNFRSLQNSRRLSPIQNNKQSLNKINKVKEAFNHFKMFQKMKTQAYLPSQLFMSKIKTSLKPAIQCNLCSANNIKQNQHKNSYLIQNIYQKKTQLENSIKLKNSIRIRTQHQKRNQSEINSLKKKKITENSTFESQQHEKSSQLTPYEKEQTKMYQILYIGTRRIYCDQDFTNLQGYPIVKVGDSIKFRYQILSQLGHGAFGYVFKAFDHKRKEKVAIKIIKNHIRYQQQAKVQIKILEKAVGNNQTSNAQNIVQLKSAFLFRGHPCLVFQLLHITLYQFCFQLNFIGLSLDLIRRFVIQILHALNFLERQKIVHCDIKPENIMIKKQNKTGLKVIDFGSGCFDGQQIYNYVQSRYYRAPQIMLGIQYGCPIDMWSFGCVCFQLFAGRPLFSGESQDDQIGLFVQTLGLPSKNLILRGSRYSKFFAIQGNQIKMKESLKGRIRIPSNKTIQKQLKRCSDQQFINFVKRCVTWSPQQRLKASQALIHPWILSGIPQQLQQQHKKSVQY